MTRRVRPSEGSRPISEWSCAARSWRSAACWPHSPAAVTCCSRTIPAPARPRWPRRSPARSARASSACSSRPTCCRRTSSACPSSTRATQTFRFHEGPIFTHILLADEINRASPRTQSALLEAMAESQVSIDGVSAQLPELFFVIATQNPVEFRGTYPLPEAQMDRFAHAVRPRLRGSPPRRWRFSPRRPSAIRSTPSTPASRSTTCLALRQARAPGPRERRAEALRRRPGARHARARRACSSAPARAPRSR